jgi:hypothetical protein
MSISDAEHRTPAFSQHTLSEDVSAVMLAASGNTLNSTRPIGIRMET